MKKFDFKLETLHDYRQRLEEISLQELGTAVSRLDEEESKLSVLKELYLKASEDADRLRAASDVKGVRLYQDYIDGLRRHIEEQGRVIGVFRQEFEKKQGALLGASIERKVLDKVKEKGLGAHARSVERAQQRELDEIAAAAFRKKG